VLALTSVVFTVSSAKPQEFLRVATTTRAHSSRCLRWWRGEAQLLLRERQEDFPLRIEARVRLGYYPLPSAEAERIRQHLQLTPGFVALDPCIGEGHALAAITAGIQGHRCGIELDAYRAEQASTRAHQVVHASAFDVHCPVESVSLLYLDPPYDFEISEGKNERMERVFLQHTYRWLKPGGVAGL